MNHLELQISLRKHIPRTAQNNHPCVPVPHVTTLTIGVFADQTHLPFVV